jgi:hypothetical protein
MVTAWIAAVLGLAVAGGVAGAVLITTGPLSDGQGNRHVNTAAAQETAAIPGERTRPGHPDGTASDDQQRLAREIALAAPEIAGWLTAQGNWELLWVDRHPAATDDKSYPCGPGQCVTVAFYSWKANMGLYASLDLHTRELLGPPVEATPLLTDTLKEEAIRLALADPVVRQAVGPNVAVSNVADFEGYGVCAVHLCALVGVVSPEKAPTDRTNGTGVQVDLATGRVVLVTNHTGVLKDER